MISKKLKIYKANWYQKNKKHHREIMQIWEQKNRKKLNKTKREYERKRMRQNPEYREKRRQSCRRYYRKHRAKQLLYMEQYRYNNYKDRARDILNDAIKRGEIERPDKCIMCNKIDRIVAHHFDYKKPLIVAWLCPFCHGKIHQI